MRFLLIAILFASCGNNSNNDWTSSFENEKISTEKPDTLKITAYPVTANPEIFETAFFHGTVAQMDTFNIELYSVSIGKLSIESGKLIACDPIVMHDVKPFLQNFPIGEFPVQLSIAKIDNDERVAFARISFSDNPVTKWEFALHEGQKKIPIDSETFYGYGVDSGIGLFIDKDAKDAFDDLSNNDQNIWVDVFSKEMAKNYRNTWQYILYKFDDHSLASFSTGYGDGTYATYVGYDEKGNVCRLLTDFEIVDWLGKK
jgi:hypothetical protein